MAGQKAGTLALRLTDAAVMAAIRGEEAITAAETLSRVERVLTEKAWTGLNEANVRHILRSLHEVGYAKKRKVKVQGGRSVAHWSLSAQGKRVFIQWRNVSTAIGDDSFMEPTYEVPFG